MKFILLVAITVYWTVAQETVGALKDSTTVDVSTLPTSHLENSTIDLTVTTEMTLTTCDLNCSISTEEPTLNETTVGAKNSTSKGDIPRKASETESLRSKGVCVCDLQDNFCDINCCCDADCSSDDKMIFHHCESENLYYDTRYCDYMKYIYINNTPFEWHVNQNGLFCVVKSNLPPSYTVQRKQPLTSFSNAKLEKRNKFSWAKGPESDSISFNSTEQIAYGGNIWMVEKDGIKTFKLPKKFLSNACIIQEEVVNFVNVRNTCTQTDISEDNAGLNFDHFFQNISVVAAPQLLNISKYKNVFQECPRNICLVIIPKICDENFNICVNVSRNDTRLKVSCNFDIRHNRNDCTNVVKKLHYNFHHSGIKGYNKIELLGVLDNVSYEFGRHNFEFYQEYSVNFWWTNQTKNFSAMSSGNPGYLIGKPVLIGDIINEGNKTNVILKIERFSDDYVRTFMTLPENVNGNCVSDNEQYLPIEFGFNMLTKCKFNGTVFNKKTYFNGTEICRNIQKAVLLMWGIRHENKTVGMFGNANANNPEEWTKILYSISPEVLMNETRGRFGNSNTSLTCFGIATNLVIDVFHSKINLENLLNQEKVLGVTYSFRDFKNKTFVYNKQKNSTYFEFDLESHVVFYDISVVKHRRFVDPPSFEIKLPYDFFYPFIKIENSADRMCANYFFVYLYVFVISLY